MQFEKLFEPYDNPKFPLKNRIVMGPVATGFAKDFIPTQQMADYYGARAKGGAGLVIVEHTPTQRVGLWGPGAGAIYLKKSIPGYKLITDAVHQHGAKIAIELGSAGNTAPEALIGEPTVSASAYRCHTMQENVRAVTKEEIEQFKLDYLQCVRNAVEAGFDAVELHLTNGYFFASFISGRTNRRTDEYGGTFEGRMKLPLDIIKMIRREFGQDFPLLARVSVCEVNRGRSLEESRMVVCALEDAGIDIIDLNIGSMSEFSYEFPPYLKPQGFSLQQMADIKGSLNVPVISGGRVTEPYMAERILKDGRADFVYINRQQVADPDWAKKIAGGDIPLIRRCIGCTRCISSLAEGTHIKCSVNPFVGHETEYKIEKTDKPINVVVVGGGPAGLEAASLEAQKGNNVTLFEKEALYGGMAKTAAMAPMKWEISGFISSLIAECETNGVQLINNTAVNAQMIKDMKADKVIVATGAKPAVPPVDGIDNKNVVLATDLLDGKVFAGGKVAIIGGGLIGCDTADYLTDFGRDITIFEMMDQVGMDMWLAAQIDTFAHLKEYGVRMMPNSTAKAIKADGTLVFEQGGKEISEQFDTIVIAAGMKSDTALYDELKGMGIEATLLGDAKVPARFHEALEEAVLAAL